MSKYTSNKTWQEEVFLVDVFDQIAFGEEGSDSKGNVENHNRGGYLKKNKATILISSGTPSGDYGLVSDLDTNTNTFYFDTNIGTFYIANTTSGSITSWSKLQEIINIPNLKYRRNKFKKVSWSRFFINN